MRTSIAAMLVLALASSSACRPGPPPDASFRERDAALLERSGEDGGV